MNEPTNKSVPMLDELIKVAGMSKYWPKSISLTIKEDDWPDYRFDGKWVKASTAMFVECGGDGGPAIICTDVEKQVTRLRGKGTIAIPGFAVMQPYTWTEYGYVQTDYNCVAVVVGIDQALTSVLGLYLRDEVRDIVNSLAHVEVWKETTPGRRRVVVDSDESGNSVVVVKRLAADIDPVLPMNEKPFFKWLEEKDGYDRNPFECFLTYTGMGMLAAPERVGIFNLGDMEVFKNTHALFWRLREESRVQINTGGVEAAIQEELDRSLGKKSY
jgi:hypothetical protein